MGEEHLGDHLGLGELNQRATAAASALLQKTTKAQAPDLRHVALARRLFVICCLAALGVVIGAILVVAFLASGALPWIVGTVLVLATVGVIVLGPTLVGTVGSSPCPSSSSRAPGRSRYRPAAGPQRRRGCWPS